MLCLCCGQVRGLVEGELMNEDYIGLKKGKWEIEGW